MNREGFGIRFGAAFVDGLIVGIPAGILTKIGGENFGPFLGAAAMLGYTSLEIFKAATPGKMIFKLRISNADGSQASGDALFKRWLVKQAPNCLWFVSALFTLLSLKAIGGLFNWVTMFAGIGYVISCCLTFRAQRQALHDTLTHTAVYRTQQTAPAMQMPQQQEPQKQAA